jgi:glycerol uptake facilitator-like aquaporin
VTIARATSDTFAGIRPDDVAGFITAQLLGAFAATALFKWFIPTLPNSSKNVNLPHTDEN